MSSSKPDPQTASDWRPASLGGSAAARRTDSGPEAWTAPSLLGEAPQRRAEPEESPEERTALQTAFERGYGEGMTAGRTEGSGELHPAAQALSQAAAALVSARGQLLHDVETNLTALALAMAKKIIQREVATDPTIVKTLVQRGLELVQPETPIEVRLHPSDLEVVEREVAELSGDEALEIRWSADPELERGGFFIEGPQRIVDGRMDEALRLFYERLAYE